MPGRAAVARAALLDQKVMLGMQREAARRFNQQLRNAETGDDKQGGGGTRMTHLSRHARNKLRWIQRDAPEVSEPALVAALQHGDVQGEDQRGNVRMAVDVAGTRLTVVVDPDDELVITVWRG